jgi:hypothetical protein
MKCSLAPAKGRSVIECERFELNHICPSLENLNEGENPGLGEWNEFDPLWMMLFALFILFFNEYNTTLGSFWKTISTKVNIGGDWP